MEQIRTEFKLIRNFSLDSHTILHLKPSSSFAYEYANKHVPFIMRPFCTKKAKETIVNLSQYLIKLQILIKMGK